MAYTFLTHLKSTSALISVQVHVVHEQGARGQGRHGHTGHGGGGGHTRHSAGPVAVLDIIEFKVDLHLVVLQSNEGQSKAWVSVPEELQGDVEDVTSNSGGTSYGGGQVGGVTDHGGITQLVTGGLGQLVPDVDPIAVVFIYALATDFQLDGLDQNVTNPVQPAEGSTGVDGHVGQLHAQVSAVDQITIAADGAGDLLGPVTQAVEGLLNGFQSKVGVSAVNDLEEGDLRVTGEVNVLSAVSYQ